MGEQVFSSENAGEVQLRVQEPSRGVSNYCEVVAVWIVVVKGASLADPARTNLLKSQTPDP